MTTHLLIAVGSADDPDNTQQWISAGVGLEEVQGMGNHWVIRRRWQIDRQSGWPVNLRTGSKFTIILVCYQLEDCEGLSEVHILISNLVLLFVNNNISISFETLIFIVVLSGLWINSVFILNSNTVKKSQCHL